MKYYIADPIKVGANTFYAFLGNTGEVEEEESIPEGASKWEPAKVQEGHLMYWDGIGWASGPDVRTMNFSELQNKVRRYIQENFSWQSSRLTLPYPKEEKESWMIQLQDAQNVLKGSNKTLMLGTLAKARGVNLKELAQKVVDKSTAYYSEYAKILGEYQKEVDQLESAKSLKDLPKFDLRVLLK